MASDKKKIKRIIGGSLIVISGITGFYQYRFSKVQADSKEYIAVATKKIEKNQELTSDNVKLVLRNKDDVLNENINSLNLVIGTIATEEIYKNEDININRIISKEDFEKEGYRLISIKVKDDKIDAFVGYEVNPGDKVDLLYYDIGGTYEGKPFLEKQVVYDLKSAEGVSYKDKGEGFIPKYALIWVKKNIAEEIYARQEEGGYFKFQLYIDRFANENNKSKFKKGE